MNKKNERIDYKNIVFGILISVLVTAAALFAFSLVMFFTDLDVYLAAPLASLALAAGCITGSYFSARREKRRGLLTGLLVSGIQFAILSLVGLIISSDSFGILFLLHAAVMLLSGCIGGICGVNSATKNKIKI